MEIRKYEDESTTEVYKFVIHCECCGKTVLNAASQTEACYKPKLFSGKSEQRAKELLWMRGHDQAFENASREAMQQLNRCEVCGSLVCDECTVISEKMNGGIVCKACAEQEKRK